MLLFNKLCSRRRHGKAKQPELYNNNTGVSDNINLIMTMHSQLFVRFRPWFLKGLQFQVCLIVSTKLLLEASYPGTALGLFSIIDFSGRQ